MRIHVECTNRHYDNRKIIMTSNTLFEDRFVISNVDNSKFEKVSRIKAKSTGYDAELILDVHSELFRVEEKVTPYFSASFTPSIFS
ncbi:RNA polymerase subunit 8c, putative [Plasmodium ovale wallikeri]|uniref:RNA polymerase subunit 8c, putative n=1 Tax=Plasmodium ovale wallikeri TaxID=864142 RepID=A0A1A8ZX46_PLAOA|nr:RNA polymerase subunit 8c, putative [Plasmodium ovale wallikeri]SBT48869.1 RNA polymerase subunit 8c, putative [Plasmodium ovale wallikeri]